jgi:hypothetical protein
MTFVNPTFNDTAGVFTYVNSITNDAFTPLMIVVIWVVMFLIFKTSWRGETAFTTSSFITFLISVLLRAAGLISDWMVITVMLIFVAGIFITAKIGSDETL